MSRSVQKQEQEPSEGEQRAWRMAANKRREQERKEDRKVR